VIDVKEPLEFSLEVPFPFENILSFPIFFGPFCLEGLSNVQIQTKDGKMMGKKRRLWMKWGTMLVMIGLVAIQTEAHGNSWNWEFFLSNGESNFFYDPDMVSRSPERIVRAWWKEVFKTKKVLRSRGFTGSEYEKAAYQINVTEINCPTKEFCRKAFLLCSEEGDNILCTIHRQRPEEWIPVRQEQPIGVLYLKLCQ
jgi:hypothetical protein